MTNICIGCGHYQVDKEIINQGEKSFAKCKICGVMNPYLSLPLFIISGASGVGKTSVLNNLKERLNNFVFLDADNLVIENDFSDKSKENLLRVFKNIHQSSRSVIVSVCFFPQHFYDSFEKRYFSDIHYLTLYCDEKDLTNRLNSRPEWRHETIEPFIITNKWVISQINVNNRMSFFYNSNNRILEVTNEIEVYINEHANSDNKYSNSSTMDRT